MADGGCSEKDVILIVDDDEAVAEMIAGLVDGFGCAYESFDDPVKALRYYEKNSEKITLMVTDLTMPGLSGPDLIGRALRLNPSLPVILVIGYPGQEIPAGIPPLVSRIIPKPFTKAELFDTVRAALAENRPAS